MIIGQDFYYYMIAIASMGFWASAYVFIHSNKRAWEHKAASLLVGLFTMTIAIGVLGVGGDLPVELEQYFSLWLLSFIAIYICIRAVDRWVYNNERRLQACKDREFNRQMRKASSTGEWDDTTS